VRRLFPTEAAALAFAAEAEKPLGLGRSLTNGEVTLAHYAQRFLEQIRHDGLAPRTIASYQDMLRVHILPALGAMKLRHIRRRDVRTLLTGLHERGWRLVVTSGPGRTTRRVTGPTKRYAANTVWLVRATLSAVLARVVDDDSTRACWRDARCVVVGPRHSRLEGS
jgi:hypothetical protein